MDAVKVKTWLRTHTTEVAIGLVTTILGGILVSYIVQEGARFQPPANLQQTAQAKATLAVEETRVFIYSDPNKKQAELAATGTQQEEETTEQHQNTQAAMTAQSAPTPTVVLQESQWVDEGRSQKFLRDKVVISLHTVSYSPSLVDATVGAYNAPNMLIEGEKVGYRGEYLVHRDLYEIRITATDGVHDRVEFTVSMLPQAVGITAIDPTPTSTQDSAYPTPATSTLSPPATSMPSATPKPPHTRTTVPAATRTPTPTKTPMPPLLTETPVSPTPTASPKPTTRTPAPTPTETSPPPTDTPLPPKSPAGSAAQGKIAFVSDRSGEKQIWLMNPDGKDQRRITWRGENVRPSWSFDGEWLAFASTRDDNEEIYVMRPDGSDLRNVTQSPWSNENEPTWSPDGKRLAFSSDRWANEDIYIIDVMGSDWIRIVESTEQEKMPDWSSRGQIVFRSKLSGNADIWVANADGSNLYNASHDEWPNNVPRWSPDGSQIAYTAKVNGTHDLYLMNADGSDQRPVVQDFVYLWAADWSPDGRTLVFAMETDCPSGWKEACNREIYTMPATGGPKTRLTFEEANDWNPVWAPR